MSETREKLEDKMQQNIGWSSSKIGRLASNSRIRLLAGLVVIVAACLVAYIPAIRGGFIWDDDSYVQNNRTLRSIGGLGQIWFRIGATPQYYPMVHTTYWLEYRFWKLDPTGYHMVNVLLHAVGAVLLWRVLTALQLPGAWVAAAVFALHPVHVESVAWITERKNVLSGVFYLSAALAYLRYALAPRDELSHDRPERFYWLSLVLFACALLSKTVACTLPAVLLLVLWWKRERIGLADVRALVPFFMLGIVFARLTVWLEKHHVGAIGEEWDLSLVERCLLAGRVLWFYTGKLFWPGQLTFIYPRWQIDAQVWQQYLYPVAVISITVAFWFARKRISKGPLVAILCFAGTLLPALGFFNVYPMRFSFVADHFQYLASAGLIALVAAVGYVTLNRLSKCGKGIATIIVVFLLVTLGTLTWYQGHIYKDIETLWRDTLRKNPYAWIAHNNLGLMLGSQGKIDEAISHFHQALRIVPDNVAARNNLGNALQSQGKLDEAISHYRQALQVRPNYAAAHNNLGLALQSQGKLDEAIEHYRHALRVSPNYAKAHYNLGLALRTQGKLDEAISHYRRTLRIAPDNADAHNNLALALQSQGKLDEAISHYRLALQAQPDYAPAHYNLGLVLHSEDKLNEAISHYRQALQTRPDYAAAHHNLGLALQSQGKLDEAISHYRQALQIKPYDAETHNNLGSALQLQGKLDEAVSHYRQALRIAPDNAKARNNLGLALQSQSKLDEAISHYRQALRTAPDNAEAHNNLGLALQSHGKLDEAISHYHQALEVRPNHANAHHNLGTVLLTQGKLDEAASHFRQALRIKPDFANAHNNLAWILATHPDPNIRDANQAIELAERAAGLTKYQDISILDTLATAYAAAGQFDRAVRTAQIALVLASAAQNEHLANHIRKQLELYRQAKP